MAINTYRIGVLGLTHDHIWKNLEQLHQVTGAVLVGAADPNRPLLDEAKKRFDCATYRDFEQLLDREKLDAVYVFSDNASGVELGEMAALRGLHVMLEKPMAASLEGADRLLAAARRGQVRMMVNWPFAWWPALQHALTLTAEGAIGDVWQVRYRAAHQGPRELGCSEFFCDWLYERELNGGGALVDYGCYGAALASQLLGLPYRVLGMSGRLQKEDIPVDDNAVIVMTYPRAMALAEASWTQIGNLTSYITVIYGTRGTLLVEAGTAGRLWRATQEQPDGQLLDVPPLAPHESTASANFLHGLATGTPFAAPCEARISRDAQEIIEAALISAEGGAEVPLPLRVY